MSAPIDPIEGLQPHGLPNPFDLPVQSVPPPVSPDSAIDGHIVRTGVVNSDEGNPLGRAPKLRASDVPVGKRKFKCAENGGRVTWAWGGDTDWNPTLEHLWKALNVAAMALGWVSAAVAIVRAGRIIRESMRSAAAAEFGAEVAMLRHDVESYAKDAETKASDLLRRVGRLERALEKKLAERAERMEEADSPAAAIRASFDRKRDEISEAVAGFKRRIEDILKDKREGDVDNGRGG